MTDDDLAQILSRTPREQMKVSMSKAGTFLKVGAEQHEITDRQAEFLWEFWQGGFRNNAIAR